MTPPPRPPGWLAHTVTRRPCTLPGARRYRRGHWRDTCTNGAKEMNLPNPSYDADMLRRAAEACRNLTKQVTDGRTEWFSWVPQHLERFADRLEELDVEEAL